MTTVAAPPVERERLEPAPRRPTPQRSSAAGLIGLAAIAVLLPLRGTWVASVALTLLTFTVPGILALRAIRVSSRAVRKFPLYIPAASLLVMLIGGLLADLLGPSLGISKPLHGDATSVATLAVGAVLWVIGLNAPKEGRFPWRSILAEPSLLLPLVLPLLAAAGALLLNNGHGPTVARASAVAVAICLFLGLTFANRLSRGQVGMLIFACALAAQWSFSLRSQEVVGFDITTEIEIAKHTLAAGIWHPVHHNDAYSAMLSVTVLPSVLHALTGASPLISFKLLYPILTALLPVSVFLIGERFMARRFAALAAALLLVQSYFFSLLPELARQEIGLLFFAVLAASLCDPRVRQRARLFLIAGMAAGLVVSHYSSTYLAIPPVIIALLIQIVLGRTQRGPILLAPLLTAAVVLVGGAAIWYGAVTHSSSNLTSFSNAVTQRGLDLLPNRSGNVITSYFRGNVTSDVTAQRYQALAVSNYRDRPYIHPVPAASQPRYALKGAKVPEPRVKAPTVAHALNVWSTAEGELMLLFGVIGSLLMVLRRRSRYAVRRAGALALGTIAVLTVIRFSGTVAASYNQTRALAQSLILLALPVGWLLQLLTSKLRGRSAAVVSAGLALAVTLVFAEQVGISGAFLGGGTTLNLAQSGEDFERLYMTPAELAGAQWAADASRHQLLWADPYGQLRLSATAGVTAFNEVTPLTLDRHAWLYGTHTNVVLGRARGSVNNVQAIYQWPAAFLHDWFDTVYSNGDSTVFHR
jgi:uncharacterized membrane protein